MKLLFRKMSLYTIVALLSTTSIAFGAASNEAGSNNESKLISSIVENKHAVTKKTLMKILNHALCMACEYSNENAARLLLAHKAEINATDSQGNTALSIAAEKNLTSIVGLLITQGAQLEKRNQYGATPLLNACINGYGENIEAIKQLLEAGANLKAKNKDNKTALEIAQENNYSDIADLLKNWGRARK